MHISILKKIIENKCYFMENFKMLGFFSFRLQMNPHTDFKNCHKKKSFEIKCQHSKCDFCEAF